MELAPIMQSVSIFANLLAKIRISGENAKEKQKNFIIFLSTNGAVRANKLQSSPTSPIGIC
jgi:hypothetical protein